VAVARIEVKDVDAADGDGFRADAAGWDRGSVPVLILEVGFDGDIVSEVVVQANAGGVDHRVGADVLHVAKNVTPSEIVDAAAADEEVGIWMEAADGVFDLWTDEKVFLTADGATVNRIGAANLGDGSKGAEVEHCDVDAGGDAKIFAAAEVGERTCACNECGELKLLGCGRRALGECTIGHERDCREQCQRQERLCELHSILGLLIYVT